MCIFDQADAEHSWTAAVAIRRPARQDQLMQRARTGDKMPGIATRHNICPARAEFSADVPESIEMVHTAAIEAWCRAD
jgi:hypothetical protein